MRYSKILVLTSLLAGGCQSGSSNDKPQPEPGTCNAEANATFVESKDGVINQSTLDDFGRDFFEMVKLYEKTNPSGLDWEISREKALVMGGETYGLQYSENAGAWSVVSANGATVGTLTPFRTTSCETVSLLKLTMFMPEEEASVQIRYTSL